MYRPRDHRLLLNILRRIEKKHGKLKGRKSIEFTARLTANFAIISDQVLALWGNDKGGAKRIRRLVQTLYSSYLQRPKELLIQDIHREKNSDWLIHQKWVGMALPLLDISGKQTNISHEIDYLKELGVNLVHLLPRLKQLKNNAENDNVQRLLKSEAIDGRSELGKISKKLRKNEILLSLELNPIKANSLKSGKIFNGISGYIKMIEELLTRANQGVDILKLNTKFFWLTENGTNGLSQSEIHTLLKLMKGCIEVVAPGVKLCVEPNGSAKEDISYYGETEGAKECDIVYHNSLTALIWNSLATTKTDLLYKSLGKLPAKPMGTTWFNHLAGQEPMALEIDDEDIYQVGYDAKLHRDFLLDYYTGKFKGSFAAGTITPTLKNQQAGIVSTLASLAGLEQAIDLKNQQQLEMSLKKIYLVQALMMSYGGLPLLFKGDEIGQTYNHHNKTNEHAKKDLNPEMHKSAMYREAVKKRNKTTSIEHKIFRGLQKIIRLRRTSPEFADNNNCQLVYCENHHVLAFLRYQRTTSSDQRSNRTLILANFQPSVQLINKSILLHQGFDLSGEFIDKLTRHKPRYVNDLIELQPYQCYFLSENL